MADFGFVADSARAPESAASTNEFGFTPLSEAEAKSDKFGTTGEQLKTAAEGAASAATLGLSTKAETALGVDPEDIRARREENPISHGLGQAAGLVGSSLLVPGGGAAGLMEGAGAGLAKAVGLGAAESTAAKIAAAAARQAVEGAIFQGGDEVSKMITNDPEQTLGTALSHTGFAALALGGFGAGTKALGIAGKAGLDAIGSNKLVADFKSTIKNALDPAPLEQRIAGELQQIHSALKPQAAEAPLEAESRVFKMAKRSDLQAAPEAMAGEAVAPTAPDSPTRLSNKDEFFPVRQGADDLKDLRKAKAARKALGQDWAGKVAPDSPLTPIERKFMTRVGSNFQVDPTKVADSLGQEGSKDILKDALKLVDKEGLNISTTGIQEALGKKSVGQQLAHSYIEKGLGNTAAAGIGSIVGGAVGHPGLGALIGKAALGDYLNSIIPTIIKPLLEGNISGAGFEAASNLANATIKGQRALSSASDALFKPGASKALSDLTPKPSDIEKLSDWVAKGDANPQSLMAVGDSQVGHYLPQYQTAMAQKAAQVHTYLSQAKPQPYQQGLFGKTVDPSKAQETAFNRTLEIAQQPLTLLKQMDKGTLTLKDVTDVKSMHPDAFKAMSQSLVNAITTASSKGDTIPYHLRQMITLFLGNPVDPTLSQPSIAAFQAVHAGPAQQTPEAGQPAQKPNSGSTKALGKLPEDYRTPSQTRSQKAQGGH